MLVAFALWACSPEPSGPSQVPGGIGWTLLRTVSPTLVVEGVAATPFGPDQYLVSVTVRAGGAGGCGFPRLTGFQQSGTSLAAQITRSPSSDTCAIVDAISFYVALDRAVISDTVTRVAIGEPCEGPRCTAPLPKLNE